MLSPAEQRGGELIYQINASANNLRFHGCQPNVVQVNGNQYKDLCAWLNFFCDDTSPFAGKLYDLMGLEVRVADDAVGTVYEDRGSLAN